MPQSIEYITSNGSNVFVASNTTGTVSIAVDYRLILSNIANSLFSISTGIQNTNSTLSNISYDINVIKTLGNTGGVGYKTTTPFGWIGQSALYQLYVEQGYALSNSFVVDAATQTAALDRLKLSAQKLKDNLDEDL